MNKQLIVSGWDDSSRIYTIQNEKTVISLSFGENCLAVACGDDETLTFQKETREGPPLALLVKELGNCGSLHVSSIFCFRVNKDKVFYTKRLRPEVMTFQFPKIVQHIACGERHTLITTTNECYSIGMGEYGELGLGLEVTTTFVPMKIEFNHFLHHKSNKNLEITSIAAGPYHSCVVVNPLGILYTFGNGAYYRLGHGSDENVYSPKVVEDLLGVGELLPNGQSLGIAMVACSTWHTIAVAVGTNDVFGWGWNKFGQIGPHPTPTADNMSDWQDPLTIAQHAATIISTPERLSFLEVESFVGEEGDIQSIACGNRHTVLCTKPPGNRLIVW